MDNGWISLDQIAVLLIIIIFLFGVVLAWIKIMTTKQINENRELTDDLERVIKKNIKDAVEEIQKDISKKITVLEMDTGRKRTQDN